VKDLGYNEKGELVRDRHDTEQLVEEEKEEDNMEIVEINNTTVSDSTHRINKVTDSSLDFIDKEI